MIDLDVMFQYIELREQGHSAKELEEVILQDAQDKCNEECKKVMDDHIVPFLKKAQEESERKGNRLLEQVRSIDITAPALALMEEYRKQIEEHEEVGAKIALALTEEIACLKAMSLLKKSAQAKLSSLNTTLASTSATPKWVEPLYEWGKEASKTACRNKRVGKS